MTEIRFYHLQKTPLEHALPMILEKALAAEYRILLRVPDEHIKKSLDSWLWTYRDDSFLPHATDKDKQVSRQPIVITDDTQDNPNGANMLVLTHGCTYAKPDDFKLCCEMLNGAVEEQVQSARSRWKDYKAQGLTVTYWAQDEQGRWAQKA